MRRSRNVEKFEDARKKINKNSHCSKKKRLMKQSNRLDLQRISHS